MTLKNDRVTLTQPELECVVESTIERTLERLGVDVENPMETQRDFQFVRDWRKSSESVKSKTLVSVIGILVAGTMGALFMGIRAMILKH